MLSPAAVQSGRVAEGKVPMGTLAHPTALSAPTSPARDYTSPTPGVKRSRSEECTLPHIKAERTPQRLMGLTYPAATEVHPAPEINMEERGGAPPRARGKAVQAHPARSSLIPKEKLSGYIWLHDRDRSSPTKQKGWAEWAYQMRHRAREDMRIIVDPPMARAEIRLLIDLLRPVRRGLTFPEGIPEVHKDMFFEHWMASSFFLEMVARWAAPHRREDLWRALSVVQYAAHRGPNVQHSSPLI